VSVLSFVILGSGSSGGVPRADGYWGVCDPTEPKNRRTRCSLLVRRKPDVEGAPQTTLVVDTAPEFREQVAAAGVTHLDAVLYTHDHADQTHGIDDVRAFWLRQRRRTPCYMDAYTHDRLMRRFGYVFHGEGGYPPICDALPMPPFGQPWAVDGPSGPIPVIGFDQDHGAIRSVGFRFGKVAYSADVVDFPPEAEALLQDLDVWIVDALWPARPHPTHAHLEKTLEWIERYRPRRAILTNMHLDLDYKSLKDSLPPNVEPAFDGLEFETLIDTENSSETAT
jgi:phosphoribosyl 1,2-cyclic phosphate phosphodiesterase